MKNSTFEQSNKCISFDFIMKEHPGEKKIE